MKLYSKILMIIVVIFFSNCRKDEEDILIFKLHGTYEEGKDYRCKLADGSYLGVALNHDKGLMNFYNFPLDSSYRQKFSFYENGTFLSKVKLNKNLDEFGMAIFCYNTSGNLNSIYEYKNGRKINKAISFQDSTSALIKTISYFNEDELVYLKEYINKKGKKYKEERGGETTFFNGKGNVVD